MKTFFQSSTGKMAAQQGLPFIVSLLITELFLELHSFSLELLCFSATWFVTSFLYGKARKAIGMRMNTKQNAQKAGIAPLA